MDAGDDGGFPVVVGDACDLYDFGSGGPFVVEAEVDAEADEGGEIEDEDREAHQEGRAMALAGELEMLGVESHDGDCVH